MQRFSRWAPLKGWHHMENDFRDTHPGSQDQPWGRWTVELHRRMRWKANFLEVQVALKEGGKCPLGRAVASRTEPPRVGAVDLQAMLAEVVEERCICHCRYPVDFHARDWLSFPWPEYPKDRTCSFSKKSH